MLDYFLFTIFSLGASYLLFRIVLAKQKTFQFNRYFLLVSLLLCLIAPFIEFDVFKSLPSITEITLTTLAEPELTSSAYESYQIQGEAIKPRESTHSFFWIYLAVTTLFVLRFLRNSAQMYRLTQSRYTNIGQLKVVENDAFEIASSFFNYLFIKDIERLNTTDYTNIIKHESIHFEQLHSLDILFIEVISCGFWFNPFIWLYKKSIVQNHEYIADDLSIASGLDSEAYSNTIINLGKERHRFPLTSGFNFIKIKNRIIMLHQSKASVANRTLKICAVLLLFMGILVLTSYKDLKNPLVVVIDAGHGGRDSGNSTEGMMEKDIMLNITKELTVLSTDQLKIIPTRTQDEFLSLTDRIDFANAKNPDLVVSLHTNSSQNKLANGVEAYYQKDGEFSEVSASYAKILLENQRDIFSIQRGVKTGRMYITRHAQCPALMLELGFLTNEKDNTLLKDISNQKRIAKAVFEGLEEIRATKLN